LFRGSITRAADQGRSPRTGGGERARVDKTRVARRVLHDDRVLRAAASRSARSFERNGASFGVVRRKHHNPVPGGGSRRPGADRTLTDSIESISSDHPGAQEKRAVARDGRSAMALKQGSKACRRGKDGASARTRVRASRVIVRWRGTRLAGSASASARGNEWTSSGLPDVVQDLSGRGFKPSGRPKAGSARVRPAPINDTSAQALHHGLLRCRRWRIGS